MIKHIMTFLFLFLFSNAFGQFVDLSGHIVDKESNNSLPFATVEIYHLKTGTIADENGDFTLKISSAELNVDSMEFSYVGYKKYKIAVNDFLKMSIKTIPIEVNPICLDEIVVIPREYKTVIVGIKDKKPWGKQYANVFSGNLGNFIENKKHKIGWIKSVSFYIAEEGHAETPFRIRIYGLDVENKCPGKDILIENVVVSSKNVGWFAVDISKYEVPFPVEGAFVMMEWINSGDQYYFEKEIPVKVDVDEAKKTERRKFYGQTIGTVSKKPQIVMWGRGLGNDWVPYRFYYKGYINAMINAEIAYSVDLK